MTRVRTIVLLLALALPLPACDRGAPADPPALVGAEAKMAEGRYGEAFRDLRSIDLGLMPGSAASLRAARTAVKGLDFPLALKFLDADARSGGLRSADGRLLRAESLLRSGDTPGAKKALAELEQGGIRTERWRFLYALLCLVQGDQEGGAKELDALASGGARDPEILVRWVETALSAPPEARRRLNEALARTTDRGPVLAAFGTWSLRKGGDPGLARLHLEEAVALQPWNRDARLDLVRALLLQSGPANTGVACREAERLVDQDPADTVARLLLAEAWGEKGRMDLPTGGEGPTPATLRSWERAEKEYGILLQGRLDDPTTAVRILQGLARMQVEEVLLDPPGSSMGEGTHYARAMEWLRRAEDIDPEGKLEGGPHGARFLAETLYLRGRAARKAHTGVSDNTLAVGLFEKAFKVDQRHIDASWDLGMICHDFFPDDPQYQQLAAEAFRAHLSQRGIQGLPSLDPARLAIAEEAIKKAGRWVNPKAPKALREDPKDPVKKDPPKDPPKDPVKTEPPK